MSIIRHSLSARSAAVAHSGRYTNPNGPGIAFARGPDRRQKDLRQKYGQRFSFIFYPPFACLPAWQVLARSFGMRQSYNQQVHRTAAPRLSFRGSGEFGRWIRSQRPLPAAVGDLDRSLKRIAGRAAFA
jgi:hypothetical protein